MQRTFRYTGYNPEGVFVRGKKIAQTERDVRAQLYEERLEVESIVSRPWDINPSFGRKKVDLKELMMFTRLLSALLKSGVTTSQALDVLYKQTSHVTFKQHILDVSMAVRKGGRMSEALRQHPKTFPPLFTEMVMAGEKSGSLDRMLYRLAGTLQRTQQISSKVKMATMYPGVLLAVVLVVGGLMLYYIIPEFANIFEKGGYELPTATLVLLGLSEAIRNMGSLLAVGLVALILALPRILKNPAVQEVYHRIILKLPVVGDLVLTGAMANYCRMMEMTLSSGLVVLDALRLTAETIPNRRVARALREAQREVATGSRLSAALERTQIVPPLVVAVTTVGEQSGELDVQYASTADFYEEQVLYEVDRTLKLLEPALIIIVFVAVAGLLLAVYTPLFRSISIMGG